MPNALEIKNLIAEELARIKEPARRSQLERFLTDPRERSMRWDYGKDGESFDCWQFGESSSDELILVYCDRGFGPTFPWGWLFDDEESLGMDSQWHSSLEDAAIGGGLLDASPDYEVPGPRE
jgi:hypothetical protein